MKKILFVCTGNTCRSPMAKAIAKDKYKDYSFLSAGLSAQVGAPVSQGAKNALSVLGIKTEDTETATQLTHKLMDEVDYIIPLSLNHGLIIEGLYPKYKDKVKYLFGDISDPYLQSDSVYLDCAKEIQQGLDRLCEVIQNDTED